MQVSSARRRLAREREREALELHSQGVTLRAIAQQLGYHDQGGAWKAMRRALDRLPVRAAEDYRQLELERYAELESRLFPAVMTVTKRDKAGKPLEVKVNPAVANALIRLLERRARLLGLDAAVRVTLGGDPDGAPVGVNLEGLRNEITRRLVELGSTGDSAGDPLGPLEGGAPGPSVGLGDLEEAGPGDSAG